MTDMPRILIMTGEASGDLHGAHLVEGVKKDCLLPCDGRRSAAHRCGRRGRNWSRISCKWILMGLIGLSAMKADMQRIFRIRRLIKGERWDLVVLIDNPGLNFHFARVAKACRPQACCTTLRRRCGPGGRGRMRWIQRRVDHVLAILPFEEPLYTASWRALHLRRQSHPGRGGPVLRPAGTAPAIRTCRTTGPVIGLFPGSRKGRTARTHAVVAGDGEATRERHPTMQFILAQASTIQDQLLRRLMRESPVPIRVFRNQASEIMAASDLLVVKSGTSTLQAAVVGTPMILFYRAPSWITYRLARLLIRVPWIGLANLVAGRGIVPELIHDEASARATVGGNRTIIAGSARL